MNFPIHLWLEYIRDDGSTLTTVVTITEESAIQAAKDRVSEIADKIRNDPEDLLSLDRALLEIYFGKNNVDIYLTKEGTKNEIL